MLIILEANVMNKVFKTLQAKSDKVVGVGRGPEGLVVLVDKKVHRDELHPSELMPQEIGGEGVHVLEVGKIVAQQARTDQWDFPVPPGVSIGHEEVTAGTFGCVVRDVVSNERYMLTNNHVAAATNKGRPGDPIFQPGLIDGGTQVIGHLFDYKPIAFPTEEPTCDIAGGVVSFLNSMAEVIGSGHKLQAVKANNAVNLIDAALVKPVSDRAVSDEILEIGSVAGATEARLGMNVRKSGRTTGLTRGFVVLLDATVEVSYGENKVGIFEKQIIFDAMSAGGDSGSLIVTEELPTLAVALLFAGSPQVTIGSPIQFVFEEFEVLV